MLSKLVFILFSGLLLIGGSASARGGVGAVTAGPVMSSARSGHTATLLIDGRVLIAGGMIAEHNNLSSAELYNPETATFAPTGSLNVARVSHTATMLNDGRVLIVGGWGATILDSAELYDPAAGMFTLTGGLSTPRTGFTATLLDAGMVLVVGGNYNRQALNSAEIYDPITGQFTPTASLNVSREAHTATRLTDGRVLIAGGRQGDEVLHTLEIYDPATHEFTLAGEMTIPRHKHAAALLPDGDVLLMGGANERDWRGRYNSAEVYRVEQQTSTAADDMNDARFKLADAIALLNNGSLVVAGGSAVVEVFDSAAGMFHSAHNGVDTARFFSTATALLDGTALIAGGYDQNITSTAATWLFTPGG